MYKFIFCDTETTGLEPEDRLLQLATGINTNGKFLSTNNLFNPGLPIKTKAMSVHHITEKMVANAPTFKGSPEAIEFEKLMQEERTIFVAHNAPFDIGMVNREGIAVPRYICTQQLAKHFDVSATIESYSLQFLRYHYGMEIEATAHDALGDVLILAELFKLQYATVKALHPSYDEDAIAEEMMRLSCTPALLAKMPFGKYKGQNFSTISKSYLRWMLDNMTDLKEDVLFTIKHHLK